MTARDEDWECPNCHQSPLLGEGMEIPEHRLCGACASDEVTELRATVARLKLSPKLEREREIADWIVTTCTLFGASQSTALKVAGTFLEAMEGEPPGDERPQGDLFGAVRAAQKETRRKNAWLRYIAVKCRGSAPDIARQGIHGPKWPHGYEEADGG